MSNKALVIQDAQAPSFDANSFMAARNLVAKFCSTGPSALFSIKTEKYKCIVVSMAMTHEDPLEIIESLRRTEDELGLPPHQILVATSYSQPTHDEVRRLNINGQIRTHHMK